MAESTLNQVQRLVEQLSPHEQAHLLASLALRMAQVVTSTSAPASVTPRETAEAWEEFFRLGRGPRRQCYTSGRNLDGGSAGDAAVAHEAGSTRVTLDNEHLTRLIKRMTVCTPAVALAALTPPPQPPA